MTGLHDTPPVAPWSVMGLVVERVDAQWYASRDEMAQTRHFSGLRHFFEKGD
jgi:hypothetical protein